MIFPMTVHRQHKRTDAGGDKAADVDEKGDIHSVWSSIFVCKFILHAFKRSNRTWNSSPR